MSNAKETEGGWMWYVRNVKENTTCEQINYKDLMKNYQSGISWQNTVKEINNVSN